MATSMQMHGDGERAQQAQSTMKVLIQVTRSQSYGLLLRLGKLSK